MAFIRNCIITAAVLFCNILSTTAQTVYYPAQSSQLLKSTAEDAAMLLQKAVPGSNFSVKSYTSIPSTGIIFIYDTTITDYQACKVKSDGAGYIKFTAAGDNGLHFGIYQYLQQQGYRFYQPGSIWEMVPALTSAYKKTDTIYTCSYKYKTWFISGGHNRWAMDQGSIGWDIYFGDNGHNWALYQRRNGMLGAFAFTGHRDDINRGDYFTTIQNNPCYVANYDGSRQANSQSVPDINNAAAKALWANTIEQKFTKYKNTIYSNKTLYTDIYRNFKYNHSYIGIEVPDGSKFGNSKDNEVCTAVDYPKESDQHFILANATVQSILAKYPDQHFQLYAYSGHSDVPSASIVINKNIDIQLIPAVYQMESSTNGLRNRWYNRSSNVSEYLYLNLSGWSGETPSFKWSDVQNTLDIAKLKKSQGVAWEASPAKFGSLPVLLACNSFLKDDISVDSTLHEFCNNMFGAANNTVYKIIRSWGEEATAPGKYSMQLYLQMMNTAVQQTQNAPQVVKERLRELKAYMHYMVLYYDLANNDQDKTTTTKADKDAALCIYLAKTNKMQLVNSYYTIATITSKYSTTSDFYAKYNVVNGTAYQNGNLPLITANEIDNDFLQDVNKYANRLEQFKPEDATYIQSQFKTNNIAPLAVINTKITYTNGINYYNKTSYNIIASAAGNFTIRYTPGFDMPGKGYINFLVESTDKILEIVKDFSIDNNSGAGTLKVDLPQAGNYTLTVVSKYKSSVELTITTNGNYFYKNGAFLGSKTENYKSSMSSLPGYFYVPNGIGKIYCNVNSSSSGKYAGEAAINNNFNIKDNNGNLVQLHFVTPKDSTLMYVEIPEGAGGTFWQVTTMSQYNMQFVNISNMLWYASRTECTGTNFTAAVINENGKCITRLTAAVKANGLSWEVNDNGRILKYSNQSTVDLPNYVSADAAITLTTSTGCSVTKVLSSDAKYLSDKQGCANGVATATSTPSSIATTLTATPVMYPNPSAGIFNCMQNGAVAIADEIVIYNTQGNPVGSFKNAKQFNISNFTAGLYVYRMVIKGEVYKGKMIKL